MNRAGWQGSRRAPNSVEDEGRYDPRGLRLRSSSATVPRDARSITNDGASNPMFCGEMLGDAAASARRSQYVGLPCLAKAAALAAGVRPKITLPSSQRWLSS